MNQRKVGTTGIQGSQQLDSGTSALTRMPSPSKPTPAASHGSDPDWIMSGAIPVGAGLPSVVRIPIPGTGGLCIELSPRGRVPPTGSTSTLFFQDASGKRHLRLDYGYNTKTKTVDYHWNQKGTHEHFRIEGHTPAGRAGELAYKSAKYFRYAGRALLVVGVAIDVVSIVKADRPLRRASEVVAGWAGAWAGCEVVGAGGAALGSLGSPLGTAIGGIGGCIIGGIGGYYGGSAVGAEVYDWAEGTKFEPLPEESPAGETP
jgi:hypothetical protein